MTSRCSLADAACGLRWRHHRRKACAALTALVNASDAVLQRELIARIHAQPPEFFERLVIDVLLAMGYGSDRAEMARCLGRSGDGGIDGIITLDELGFDSSTSRPSA